MTIPYKKKTANLNMEWRTYDWNDICNGIIVIPGKEVADWLVN